MRAWIRNNRGFLLFLLLLGLFRTAVADWNPIPSGSMHPTLLEGDLVFVDRLAYNVKVPLTDIVLAHTGEPRRGDIVTFSSPAGGTRLIKRVVALPGDLVEMRERRLIINGRPAEYRLLGIDPHALDAWPAAVAIESGGGAQHRIQWLEGRPPGPDFAQVRVPADHYLMLGDNRDNSADSRYFGFVPRRLLIGQAVRVLASAAVQNGWAPRFERFGAPLVDAERGRE